MSVNKYFALPESVAKELTYRSREFLMKEQF